MTDAAQRAVSLNDPYLQSEGRVLISGRQALVRLPLLQRALDRRAGLNTAGFISGYRGSPLGGYDAELWKARRLLERENIVFLPGVNEDLAATAVWGTQQLGFVPGRKVDGVFAIWYGKGPGVDRSGDAIKHANMQGVEANGGVLMVFGDDHAGKSSSVAHQSDIALAAHDVPILYPSSVAEILEYGLAGFALSRYAGLWTGLKVVNETAEATATVEIGTDAQFVHPPSNGDVHIRKEFLAVLQQDARIVRSKLPMAQSFVRANGLDRIAFGPCAPRFVIATAGKAYGDVRGALGLLAIDEPTAMRLGIAVYKIALIYPVEPTGIRAATASADEIFCVEEKRPHIEPQIAAILFNQPSHPRLSGKSEPDGTPLLAADAPLDALSVAIALARRLTATIRDIESQVPGFGERTNALQQRAKQAATRATPVLSRRPSFCAGCPHSRSTKVPDQSIGMTGIGCHGMAMFHPDRNPLPVSHMGGEGANWLGLAHFVNTKHVFQNLGDGTYNHSGSMAIRAAVQAKSNITYKILFNDAVAMTGGQPVEGELTVGRIAAQVLAEGVQRVVVVSDQPRRFDATRELPAGIRAEPRERLDAAQLELRETPGVTVLIYDQTCAAEKRRRRKRGTFADPDERVFINHRVCEGCGDCSTQSDCMAIQPLDTELGRKRRIDQSACNKDFSCTAGFCPSFVTVERARLRRPGPKEQLTQLPEPAEPSIARLDEDFSMLLAGVGGTGIVTISAVLGMAAHLEGRFTQLYDMTGLSQKGGAVFSHLRLSSEPMSCPVRIGHGEADLLLACDAVAAVQSEALQALAPQTSVVVNSDVSATADFHRQPDLNFAPERLIDLLREATGRTPAALPADQLAIANFGDSVVANMIMLGAAWQQGHIPLARASIEQAIQINGVAVAMNLEAFRVGRAAAATSPEALLGARPAEGPPTDLENFVERRIADLVAYQNPRYAQIYWQAVEAARSADARLSSSNSRFAWAVARSAFKLMAYKDEYEVARLYSDEQFRQALDAQFDPGYRLKVQLAPPIFARRGADGRPRKSSFGPWVFNLFNLLAKLRGLRETPFDIFGYTSERRLERGLRDSYLRWAHASAVDLSDEGYEATVTLAEAPLAVRGFGLIKHEASLALLRRLEARP